MKSVIKELAAVIILSGLNLAGGVSFAAEFEVLDKFSVGGAATFNSTTTIIVPVNQPTELWVSTSVTTPHLFVSTTGSVGIGTANPAASFEVAGEIKLGYSASSCTLSTAGTLRWHGGHISVCNGENWRQLDNQAPPTISAISPDNGPVSGGTPITITGTGFVAGPEILIGGVTATAVTVVSVTQITATTPASATGTGAKVVKITNPDGQNITGAFTYNPLPALGPVSPDNGRITGGNAITITGSHFVSGATVKIDNAAATNVSFVSAEEIRATTPGGSSTGAKDVKVTNPDGGFIVLPGGFTYNALPTITSPISPDNGLVSGGTAITINGSGFFAGATVAVGGADANGVFVNSGQMTAATPAGSSGAQNVTVTNPDGGSVVLTGGFTYNPLPTITGVSPVYGLQGTAITITGTGFMNAAGLAVAVGGVPATGFTWNSATQITATVPASTTSGAKAVTVTNSDTGAATLTNGFTYLVFASGGVVSTAGSYRVHTFTSGTNTLTVTTGGNVEYLVVGGGGGGGDGGSNTGAGGGGAGGFRTGTLTITTGDKTITIGDGGAGATSSTVNGVKGAHSVYETITSIGGGGGGSEGIAGNNGGSGGGGSRAHLGGNGTSGQGYGGGTGKEAPNYPAGGGGGAGGAGGDYVDSQSGAGGPGWASDINGTNTTYAMGAAGCGDVPYGATNGSNPLNAGAPSGDGAGGNATANFGGGGGAGYTAGGKGGSGIVIVRYSTDASFWAAAPSLESVTPASGNTKGGYTITLTGSDFATPAAVTIGGVAAAATTIDNSHITAIVPALTAGANNVVVTNPGGSSSASKVFTAIVFSATGGNNVSTVGGYKIHKFTSAGTFTTTTGGNVEVLVVAGGGGGMKVYDGGGGGGGLIYRLSYFVGSGDHSVSVGLGGLAPGGTNGGNSVFDALTALGGGGGGDDGLNGNDGGSGGGGGHAASGHGFGLQPASGSGGYGNNGGNNLYGSPNYPSGGGGGAGGSGGTPVSYSGGGGSGGIGKAYSISGTNTYYAGGGGGGSYPSGASGGTGGLGGGGTGGNSSSAAGGVNTGGGGGGSNIGSGGSGIVIIRYPN